MSKLSLVDIETIKRNLRKTPEERLDTLIGSIREAENLGIIPELEDRKKKEERINCSIQKRLSRF
ncbi:MAG: hypothetical protein HY578_05795 [Nitrospinae bacterium]|nr:hypothetical protein [Nitrospinota bacterium]